MRKTWSNTCNRWSHSLLMPLFLQPLPPFSLCFHVNFFIYFANNQAINSHGISIVRFAPQQKLTTPLKSNHFNIWSMQGVNICYIFYNCELNTTCWSEWRSQWRFYLALQVNCLSCEWIKYQANVLNWYYTITISVAVLKPFSFITFRYYHKASKSRLRQKNEKVENCVEEIVLLLLLSLLFTTIT